MNAVLRSDAPRALITGLRGFTGHYLAAELRAAGYRVFGTAHGNELAGEDCFVVDLCDREALVGVVAEVKPTVVAHLAAISFVAHGDVDAIYRTNIVGTRNLLEALGSLDERPKGVLLASSANIYGNATVEVIDETVRANPANDYAVSKLAMEYMASLWMDRLPIVIVRPFNYTGVGQGGQFLLPKIVGHFRRAERVIELGNMDVARDFSDVRMVAGIYRKLLENLPSGETVNICSGVDHSLTQVLDMMAEISGYRIKAQVNPAFVRANEIRRLRGDATKLESLVGNFDRYSLFDTLSWMYRAAQNS
jgi:GDP-6-deoxy-D-talose 4-dehydrogenase